MFNRSFGAALALVAGVVLASLSPGTATGQGVQRTAWGDPDLRGIWTNTTTTPLERPDDLVGQEVLTEEERVTRDEERARNADRPPPPGQTGAYNDFWFERGLSSTRTSLIVDPADGKLPSLTPKAATLGVTISARRYGSKDSVDSFHLYDRCLTRAMPGTMMPGFYNHNYNILQTADYVAVYVEMIHDARIIPLDGHAHISPAIHQWLGDSRGHWEGETLVVETTNLSEKAHEQRVEMLNVVFGVSEHMVLVERFTRVDADTIDYQFTVTDPTTYTAPWTVSIPMTATEGPLFEYACHEGNYALPNMLRGARADEAAADAK